MRAQEEQLRNIGIELAWHCEAGLCRVEPDLFQSLLANLVDNARKAIDGQGSIDVQCKMMPDGCSLIVQDSGHGIPADAIAHLEEAFYRVDKARSRRQGGAGLGLALCHEIAMLHGGSLHFDSVPGHGTRVIALLRGGRA